MSGIEEQSDILTLEGDEFGGWMLGKLLPSNWLSACIDFIVRLVFGWRELWYHG